MSDVSSELSRAERRARMERRDGPGWCRFLVQMPLFLGAALSTAWLAAAGSNAWLGTVVVCAVALVTFFPSLHEAGHRTAFATGVLNEALVWVSAVLMLQAPTFFREFHWEHHRSTQSITRDPEIALAPELLSGWPSNLLAYLARASGLGLFVGKALFTLTSSVLFTQAQWERLFPYVRSAHCRRVRWESRLVVIVWTILLWCLLHVPGGAHVLLAWPIAHALLGLFVMPEHAGLPHQGTQLECTRTVTSNRLLRFLMWNMNFHAEHHAYPAVPFHQLDALQERLGLSVMNRAPGYLAFHREALRRALLAPSPLEVPTSPK